MALSPVIFRSVSIFCYMAKHTEGPFEPSTFWLHPHKISLFYRMCKSSRWWCMWCFYTIMVFQHVYTAVWDIHLWWMWRYEHLQAHFSIVEKMCVCMCVCMWVCMFVCMYLCIYVGFYVYMNHIIISILNVAKEL